MALTIGTGVTIGTGISIIGEEAAPPAPAQVLNLDAATYSGSGPWIDGISNKSFTLYGSPVWSPSIGGGSFLFNSGTQYAECSTSLANLSQWTVQAWLYFEGVYGPGSALGASIVTEVYPGTTSQINYSLGNLASGNATNLQAGFYNGTWRTTPVGYSLGTNNWWFVAGTYDGATIKLYVNGSLQNSTSYSGTPVSSGGGIRLMRRWDDADYWLGRLAILTIANFAYPASGIYDNWIINKSRFGL